MSMHRASELAGLLGGTRSMNVRRKEPGKWTLETPACLTRSLRTCAASAPSAVVPVRGIYDSGRPALCVLPVSSAGLTRKPPLRPSGASIRCAPGWLVRSVVRHGGRADEVAADMRADVACKVNYALCVNKIMPQPPDLPIGMRSGSTLVSLYFGFTSHAAPHLGLTEGSMWSIIIFTVKRSYAQETAARSQVPGPSATGLLESASPTGHRRIVSDTRVFRSSRSRSGQVRNAAPGRNRGTAGEPIGRRLRVLPAFLLPGAGEFPTGRPAGIAAPEAGAQTSSQALRRGARIYPRSPSGRSLFTPGGFGFTHPGPLWHRGSSTQHRARFGAQSKKTAVNEVLPQSATGEDWAACYEQLRTDVLSQAAGSGFGLIVFLRQGMTAWMRACACAVAPVPASKSAQLLNPVNSLPGDVRSQAAVILAGILLHHTKESMLCKVTCTR